MEGKSFEAIVPGKEIWSVSRVGIGVEERAGGKVEVGWFAFDVFEGGVGFDCSGVRGCRVGAATVDGVGRSAELVRIDSKGGDQ